MLDYDQDIFNYSVEHSSGPSDICQKLKKDAEKEFEMHRMICGPLEASILRFLIQSIKAKRVLEFGTYVGYSSLAMAEVLPADGELVTLEINQKPLEFAQKYWNQSKHGEVIKPIVGDATETMKNLDGDFDLVFIDADKTNYLSYFKAGLNRLSENGIIVVDNTLWSGRVLDQKDQEADTVAIRELNQYIREDKSLSKLFLPIRDGIFIVRKNNRF